MPESKTNDVLSCEKTRDEILAARCEERSLAQEVALHVDTCDACRDAMNQLASASSETLALIVLMRGVSC